MMRSRWLAVLALLALNLCAAVSKAADVPMLTGRVMDNAEFLTPAARESISAKLKAHEDKTGNQVVVLTIPTLSDEGVEAYAVRVFESWKIGKKGKDNGVLLLVVPKEKKMRIEVGYGLEGPLPDAVASRIIRNVLAPPFKTGKFDQGMDEGVTAIISVLEGAALPLDAAESKVASSGFQYPNLSLTERLLFGAFIFGIIGLFTVIDAR